jgi:hypothetical protein
MADAIGYMLSPHPRLDRKVFDNFGHEHEKLAGTPVDR